MNTNRFLPLLTAAVLGGCTYDSTLTEPLVAHTRPLAQAQQRGEQLLIPGDALVERNGLPGVFVWQDGVARFRLLRLGGATRSGIEVLSGLKGDEQLVVGALAPILDGSPIQPR